MREMLRDTPLSALHARLGATMTAVAGWATPRHFAEGPVGEHLHTRRAAGLSDLSHLGQIVIRHPQGYGALAKAMETLVPADLLGLGEKRQCFSFFTNEGGGIEDALMLARRGDEIILVVNAACRLADIARLQTQLEECEVQEVTDRALLSLQGPMAQLALEPVARGCDIMKFHDNGLFSSDYGVLWVSRSGFTGEDGYEISVEADQADSLARRLLEHPQVAPVGLAARETLRLEAGLCCHGREIDATTSPVAAGLSWAIARARRADGPRAGGFPGVAPILQEMAEGVPRLRVGLRGEGDRALACGAALFAGEASEAPIGHVTSGGLSPSLQAPIAMGYVAAEFSREGARLFADQAGLRQPVEVSALPFLAPRVKR